LATEIARADFPADIAAVLAVIRRERTFAGVVIEAAAARAFVERTDRIRRNRAKAHRRNIEHAGRIRLRALRPADRDAEVMTVDLRRRQRVIDPLVMVGVEIQFRAERTLVEHILRTLIHDRAL